MVKSSSVGWWFGATRQLLWRRVVRLLLVQFKQWLDKPTLLLTHVVKSKKCPASVA